METFHVTCKYCDQETGEQRPATLTAIIVVFPDEGRSGIELHCTKHGDMVVKLPLDQELTEILED